MGGISYNRQRTFIAFYLSSAYPKSMLLQLLSRLVRLSRWWGCWSSWLLIRGRMLWWPCCWAALRCRWNRTDDCWPVLNKTSSSSSSLIGRSTCWATSAICLETSCWTAAQMHWRDYWAPWRVDARLAQPLLNALMAATDVATHLFFFLSFFFLPTAMPTVYTHTAII